MQLYSFSPVICPIGGEFPVLTFVSSIAPVGYTEIWNGQTAPEQPSILK